VFFGPQFFVFSSLLSPLWVNAPVPVMSTPHFLDNVPPRSLIAFRSRSLMFHLSFPSSPYWTTEHVLSFCLSTCEHGAYVVAPATVPPILFIHPLLDLAGFDLLKQDSLFFQLKNLFFPVALCPSSPIFFFFLVFSISDFLPLSFSTTLFYIVLIRSSPPPGVLKKGFGLGFFFFDECLYFCPFLSLRWQNISVFLSSDIPNTQ